MPLDSRDRPVPDSSQLAHGDVSAARRRFLAQCGKFAAATPPAVTLLLAAAERNYAAAQSAVGAPPSGGTRTDYPNGSWIIRYPDGSYWFGRGTDGAAPPGIPPGHGP